MKGDVRHVHEIVGEVFFDHVTFVTAANYEVSNVMGTVYLHDVP